MSRMTTPRSSDASGRLASLAVPHVSVVVASNSTRTMLDECLASLIGQCERARAELIVARDDDELGLEAIAKAYPAIRLVPATRGASIRELRGAGMREATGDIIMLTEDHGAPGPRWVEELCLGVDNVAEGAVGTDSVQRNRAVDWAAYFSAYGHLAAAEPGAGESMQVPVRMLPFDAPSSATS